MSFSDDELDRYARHLVLRQVGGAGQARLKQTRVLMVGAGGLGSPVLLYLAAAGVGTLGIVDDDRVALSNLQRQVLYKTADQDRLKSDAAAQALNALNPHIRLETHPVRLEPSNAAHLIGAYDLVADGSDSFATRSLVADTAMALGKPLVSAAIAQFEGQLATYKPFAHRDAAGLPTAVTPPCLHCLFPEGAENAGNCARDGILGAIAGVMGTLQATEVLKEALGVGDSMAGKLLLYDALGPRFRTIAVPRDPACAHCSGPIKTL